jgi:hypothetical protein
MVPSLGIQHPDRMVRERAYRRLPRKILHGFNGRRGSNMWLFSYRERSLVTPPEGVSDANDFQQGRECYLRVEHLSRKS